MMIVVTSLVGPAVLFPIAWLLRQRERQRLAQSWGTGIEVRLTRP